MVHTTVPESICNDRETRYLRKRIHSDYTNLIKRAKDNGYSMEQILENVLEIRNKPTYKQNHAAVFPYAFAMPLKVLSKYADAVTRMTKNNLAFVGPVVSTFATMTDADLARTCTLTLLGNLAYITRKSEQQFIVHWALGMFSRLHEILKGRLVVPPPRHA
jgi:hypothetical protein